MSSNNTSNTSNGNGEKNNSMLDFDIVESYVNYGTGDGSFYWEHVLYRQVDDPTNLIWVKTKIRIQKAG